MPESSEKVPLSQGTAAAGEGTAAAGEGSAAAGEGSAGYSGLTDEQFYDLLDTKKRLLPVHQERETAANNAVSKAMDDLSSAMATCKKATAFNTARKNSATVKDKQADERKARMLERELRSKQQSLARTRKKKPARARKSQKKKPEELEYIMLQEEHLEVLTECFRRNNFAPEHSKQCSALSQQLGLPCNKIAKWFEDARAKNKRKRNSGLAGSNTAAAPPPPPPQAAGGAAAAAASPGATPGAFAAAAGCGSGCGLAGSLCARHEFDRQFGVAAAPPPAAAPAAAAAAPAAAAGRAKTVKKRRTGRSMAAENRLVYEHARNDKKTALSHRRIKAALAAMGSPTCVCNGQVCKSIRPEELVPCGGYDAVRIGCNCAPTDLDHCPGAVGHENQVQERHDAANDKGWDTKTCLPVCLDPHTGQSACEWVNNLPAYVRYAPPFELGRHDLASLPYLQ